MEKLSDLAKLVLGLLPEEFIDEAYRESGVTPRTRLFSCALVIWLMICQRIDKKHTLGKAVMLVKGGYCDDFLECSRKRMEMSLATGGLSQARTRLPVGVVRNAADRINESIQRAQRHQLYEGLKVYLVDGSTLTLPHTKENLKKYPPCTNQYGTSHWPKIRTCYAHDLITGVALSPKYGAHYGNDAVGEVALFRGMLEELPASSVVVADRLFGIFSLAYEIAQSKRFVVVRLTDDRAAQFLKQMKKPGELSVVWAPSKTNKKKHLNHLPESAAVEGRFIWYKLHRKGFKTIDLYLFTTVDLPLKKIVELYGLRWNIETDIRSIKTGLDVDELTGGTPEMIEKEILLANTTYNLIRHMIALTASSHKIDPRRVSFSRMCDFISIIAPKMAIISQNERNLALKMFVQSIPQLTNPKRTRDSQPRKILLHRSKFPQLKNPRQNEVNSLKKQQKKVN